MSSPAAAARRKSSLLPPGLSWQQVQVAVVALPEPAGAEQLDQLCGLLAAFVNENENPKTSPHLRARAPDRLDPLVALLARPDVARSPQARLLAVRALRILARRQDVRLRCTQRVLEVVVSLLDTPTSGGGAPTDKQQQASHTGPTAALSSEAANALSNLCYEPANCTSLLKTGGMVRLLKLLSLDEGAAGAADAHTNAAGALQTLSFQPDGRAAVLKAGGPAVLLHRLASIRSDAGSSASGTSAGEVGAEERLQQRLVGALHNLSSSADGIDAIRQQGGIPPIARLLASPHSGVAASAAGALQNMSREAQARHDIRACQEALPSLAALLIGADVQAAVCAAGALAHLAEEAEGPAEGGETSSTAGSEDIAQALAGALAGAAIFHSLACSQQKMDAGISV